MMYLVEEDLLWTIINLIPMMIALVCCAKGWRKTALVFQIVSTALLFLRVQSLFFWIVPVTDLVILGLSVLLLVLSFVFTLCKRYRPGFWLLFAAMLCLLILYLLDPFLVWLYLAPVAAQ